ncbi:AMP-binding protein [Luteolibacter ambystomatis]|uniref:AMP-binding protein n=1 Tax=Luteolibacter ambystomatis TaxID=2824561 RepID=A0A975G9U7_9BACT|nr:AMP-binding protein [Luteolibacter ambystomatis]QUE51503.1 AMP-binding protein [Luteolibacter ambystomatis]
MDATRLIDPAFWSDPRPLAMGDAEVTAWCRSVPDLEGHVLFQTSGSSGTPKWIALSKQALLLSAAVVNRHLGVTEDSCWGLSLPLHHVGGFGVVARTYESAGRYAELHGKWNPAGFPEWIACHGVTHVSLVPTQVHDLVTGGHRCPECLRSIVVGGGRMEDALGQAARDLGWPVLASYGMTETGSQIATQSPEILDQSYQHAPLPLLDAWNARTDEDGRLHVSGAVLFTGSIVMGSGLRRWVPRVGEWHATGDRASVEGRWLTPLGRLDSVVKILGELVDPESVERDILALSQGSLSYGMLAISAVPDLRAGHRLVPAVVGSISEGRLLDILSAYNAMAPGFRRVAAPVFLNAMPLSELGKIRRGEVLKHLME